MADSKPLAGVRVVELATFIAVPAAGRLLADLGAEVIKIEAPSGDVLRYTAPSEGRPLLADENTTFDLENANKKCIVINTKSEAGKKILFQLLDKADVFLTNWRPDALERQSLDYESLKKKYPKLVYGSATGFGDVGPDKDLPGFDYTAFFARGGMLGTLFQKGTVPMNVIPGIGDHVTAMILAGGVLAGVYKAKMTGKGDKVSTSLMHSAIYTQAIMIQAAQYKDYGHVYPVDRRDISPMLMSYKTKDDRFIMVCSPLYEVYFPKMITILGRPDLATHEVYSNLRKLSEQKRTGELYDIMSELFLHKTCAEWVKLLTENDLPFGVAQTWEEILEDKQAWANDVFYKMKYPTGNERTLVRLPVRMQEAGPFDYKQAPMLGGSTAEVLKGLGYSDGEIDALKQSKDILSA